MSKHDITKQRASLMLRDKAGYFEATRKSGLSILNKFKLDLTTALSLKKEMPLNLWKIVKRALSDSFGVDVMGTERELREGLKEHGEFDYEVGKFINSAGETVTFLRATDVRSLCKNSFDALKDAKLLPNDNNVSLLICGNKGGSSTKIICQFANSEQSQSVKTAKLLGIYLGSKESRENIELAFGTIFEQLDKLTYDDVFIGSSPSETPAKTGNSEQITTRESPEEFTLKLRHENKTIKSLAALLPECYNEQNNVFSIECENCMNLSRKYNWTGKNVTDIFSKCYGGDLMWLSSILGLTGPNGKYFCSDCLVTLQDVKKGVPHSPVILPKYQPLTFTEGRNFEMRAMESISENAKSCKEAG